VLKTMKDLSGNNPEKAVNAKFYGH